ncbi:MAG: OmpA family protein [Chitinophagales bacterium]|nr:OmpA family protein [Bacteroidota bacterium]MBP7400145.1 OmpA family protein [Chitinophagales bacterium]MBK8488981.1 OmpA family protein [Bacteroidota bacterium]MBK8680828.1 OmpA family protein [Bacteroidota bacterium]MBP8754950.1 OmpA family protein [Chitinophagales bacterium]
MKKILMICISMVMMMQLVSAQSSGDDKPKKSKIKVNREVMLADELLKSGSYYNAIDIYLQEYNKNADNYVGYQLATTYYKARDYENSETWFKKMWDKAPTDYPQTQYYYALSLKMNGKYDAASAEFKAFNKTRMRGQEAAYYKRLAKNEQKGCDLALLLQADPVDVEITHLNKNVNNNYTDFSPKYDPTNTNLIYGSLVSEEIIDLGSSKKVELKSRIFEAKPQGEGWAKAQQLAGAINETTAHTGNGAYSPDGKRFYYTECNPNDSLQMVCKIYMSEFRNNEWTKGKELTDINASGTKYTTTHPAVGLYKGKELLYFSSNREGAVGGMDIWYSEIRNNGADYTVPQNCGRKINTAGDEITPFYSVKEDKFYFSSNGQINVGGQDIYKADGGLKSFKNVANLGFPINSSVDDFYYSLDTKRARTGFLVSNRKGGYSVKSETCCDDIYQFEYIIPPLFTIMGRVLSAKDSSVIDGAAVTLLANSAKVDSASSQTTKMFEFYRGTEYAKYRVTAIKDGYYKGEATTTTVGMIDDDTLYVDIMIEPIPIKKEIEVKNIYYELDKAELRPESFASLDSLLTVMVENPAIIAEIGSHTDSRGSDSYNLDLSQRRAQSVVDYLINKGVEPTRLVAKGYGETKLKNKCSNGAKCSEEEHAINRRTEFTIIGEIPNTNITYNQAEIDAMKALEREKQQQEDQNRQNQLDQLQQLDDEGGSDDGGGDTGDLGNEEKKTTTTTTTTTTTAGVAAAALDNTISKKGNMYEGNAMVNGVEQTKYILNPNPTLKVAMVSDEFFLLLKAAGTVSDADFINDKPTTLSDGSTVKGDVFKMKNLQLGEVMLKDVETKINTTTPQSLIVGLKIVEAGGCSFDAKNMKYKCK